jgi:hypothetical protein
MLDWLEDMVNVPTLAQQLAWHERNPTPPESSASPEPLPLMSVAGYEAAHPSLMTRLGALGGGLFGAGDAMRHEMAALNAARRQLDSLQRASLAHAIDAAAERRAAETDRRQRALAVERLGHRNVTPEERDALEELLRGGR